MSESTQEPATRVEDSSPIVSRLGANNPRFANVIARFVSRLEEQLPAMDEAFWAQDFESIAKLAHWLKGAGGTVGFDVFYEPASELESAAKAMDLSAIERQLQQIHGLAGRLVIEDEPATVSDTPQSH